MTKKKPRAWDQVRTIPDGMHPWVELLFREIHEQGLSYATVSERTGISQETFRNWRTGITPVVDKLEKTLNAVGVELWPIRIRPPEQVEDRKNEAVENVLKRLQKAA
jgi:transcriptional regulator with XRE-family HTH domain